MGFSRSLTSRPSRSFPDRARETKEKRIIVISGAKSLRSVIALDDRMHDEVFLLSQNEHSKSTWQHQLYARTRARWRIERIERRRGEYYPRSPDIRSMYNS